MKKIYKSCMLLSSLTLMLLATGCSCNDNNSNTSFNKVSIPDQPEVQTSAFNNVYIKAKYSNSSLISQYTINSYFLEGSSTSNQVNVTTNNTNTSTTYSALDPSQYLLFKITLSSSEVEYIVLVLKYDGDHDMGDYTYCSYFAHVKSSEKADTTKTMWTKDATDIFSANTDTNNSYFELAYDENTKIFTFNYLLPNSDITSDNLYNRWFIFNNND